MALMQRALFLAAAFGVSWSQEPTSEELLTRVVDRVDTLVQALQWQDDRLLESTELLYKLVAESARQNKTLNDITEAVNSVGTGVEMNEHAIQQLKWMANESFVEIISRLDAMSSAVKPVANTTAPPTSAPVWTIHQIGGSPLRLVGTRNKGRLEVFFRGEWGTVCDDDFTDAYAAVICRSLGLPYLNAKEIHNFGGGSGPIFLDQVNCNGAADARACYHGGWGVHNCAHDEDLGIECI